MRLSGLIRRKALSTSKIMEKLIRRLELKQEAEVSSKLKPEVDKSHNLESLAAAAFLRGNASKFEPYQRHLIKTAEHNEAKVLENEEKQAAQMFPYKSENLTQVIKDNTMQATPDLTIDTDVADRGFFVKGDKFCDEYIAATTRHIIEDDQNEYPYVLYDQKGAVEHIDFQAPHQDLLSAEEKYYGRRDDLNVEDENRTWQLDYGTEDANFKVESHILCSGCGAKLHCHDSALPGFVPVELLEKILKRHKYNRKMQLNELCRRCYMLKEHDFLLNINVSPVDYSSLMGHLKLIQDILILLIVDMTDIRGSIHQQLPSIIGDQKPMIVIGNKMDLLPPDARGGYLKNFRNIIKQELETAGFYERFNVLGTALVSAKTGWGVEDLISMIYLNWMTVKNHLRGDIYVVGCTNAGKSTLFNAFLQSDLCKVRAVDLIERVTTSVWPGTTLSLLKFPIMVPTERRLEVRRRRLLSDKAWLKKENSFQQQLFKETNDPKYLALTGHVASTFREDELDHVPLTKEEAQAGLLGEDTRIMVENKPQRFNLDDHSFQDGRWCFDTPGTVNRDQILDLLTLDELIKVIPHSLIVPRTVVCSEGESLLIGGLARVDVMNVFQSDETAPNKYGNRPVYFTLFASDKLPIFVVKTKKVNQFLSTRFGTEILAVPVGNSERMATFPKMQSESYTIFTKNRAYLWGSNDILLSSVGWVLVSSQFDSIIEAYTPEGRGLGVREPLLPFAAQLRGARIPGSPEYRPKFVLPDLPKKYKRKHD